MVSTVIILKSNNFGMHVPAVPCLIPKYISVSAHLLYIYMLFSIAIAIFLNFVNIKSSIAYITYYFNLLVFSLKTYFSQL